MEDARTAIKDAIKDAMRNKNTERRNALRLLDSAIKQVEVDERKELSADDVQSILQKEAKKRRESIEELEKAGRGEAAEKEAFELAVIEEFLPKQLTDDELRVFVQEAITETGAESPRDMGKIMGVVMPKVSGRADGKQVNKIAKELLS